MTSQIIVAGTFRAPPENIDALKPHLEAAVAATRQEDGCLAYCFALDVTEAGLIRVYEQWRDQAALDAHLKASSMAGFMKAAREHGLRDPQFKIFEIAGERKL